MKRKYPTSFFVMGVILNLLAIWPVLALSIVVFMLRLFLPEIPLVIPSAVLAFLLAYAIIKQLKDRKLLLKMAEEGGADSLAGKMFLDNGKGYKNTIEAVNEIIERNKSDSQWAERLALTLNCNG